MTGARSLLLLAGFAFSNVLHAATIYSNFGPGQTYLTIASELVGTLSGLASQVSVGAPFTPATTSVLTAIDFAAVYIGGPNQLNVYLTSGGLPGAPIESFTLTNLANLPTVLTVNSVTHPVLSAGTTYWVVLTANDPVNSDFGWNFNTTGATGAATRLGAGSWVLDQGTTSAFDVQGDAVPEPATFLLVSGSLLLFGMRCRGRRFHETNASHGGMGRSIGPCHQLFSD